MLFAPVIVVILFGFNDNRGRYNFTWQGFTLEKWAGVCDVRGLCDAVLASFQVALLATAIATVLGTLVAFALVRYRFRGRAPTNLLIFLPMARPSAASPGGQRHRHRHVRRRGSSHAPRPPRTAPHPRVGDACSRHMHRTQIYLTEEQERSIAARAADAGVAKAEVIRRLLDAALGLDTGAEERRRAILATAGILPDAEDWPEWLAHVRGTTRASGWLRGSCTSLHTVCRSDRI